MELGFERTDCDTFLSFLFIKRSSAYSNKPSFLFRSIHPFSPPLFFLFFSFTWTIVNSSDLTSCAYCVDPRNKRLNVRFLLWISKKKILFRIDDYIILRVRNYTLYVEIFVYILTRNITITKRKIGKNVTKNRWMVY